MYNNIGAFFGFAWIDFYL